MSYVALYRRWRPGDFDTLVGQDTVKQALTNALETGHIAHAYLFAGPRGTGKTSTARILAKALNCDHGPTAHPCGVCPNCVNIAEGNSMDVLEIDAASNRGIDSIKELRDKIAFAPVDGRYKVYVIDEVHMLTTEASNALLKTLEEPPENVVFILATTDPQKVIATIHSRCQRFDFQRVTVDDMVKHLVWVAKKSDIVADEEALRLIAIQAEGGMRDALSLLDQCAVMNQRVTEAEVRNTLGIVGRESLRELVEKLGRGDGAGALLLCKQLLEKGRDANRIMVELAEYFRALMLYQSVPEFEEIYLVDSKEYLSRNSAYFDNNRIMQATEYLASNLERIRHSLRPRVFLELALLHLCRSGEKAFAGDTAGQGVVTKIVSAPTPVPERIIQKTPVPEKKVPAPVVKKESSIQTQVPEKEVPAAPQKKAVMEAGKNPGTPGARDPQTIWQEAVDYINQQGKRAIASCARNARGVAFDGKVLTVLAPGNKFVAERLAKDDFRKILEDTILTIERIPVECNFVTEYSGTVAVRAEPVPQEELPPTVKTALAAFGGTVKKL